MGGRDGGGEEVGLEIFPHGGDLISPSPPFWRGGRVRLARGGGEGGGGGGGRACETHGLEGEGGGGVSVRDLFCGGVGDLSVWVGWGMDVG